MNITPALLLSAVGCTPERADLYAAALDDGCREYEINTVDRLAHFLSQIGHESGAFAHVREIWGPTPAQQRYEGRADLGNIHPGDGLKYCGRGLLQTTGRANYQSLRDRLRAKGIDAPDFVAAPHLLELPKWAVLSACDYWDMRHINRLADANDFVAVTRAVNGGTNGIDDRRRRWERAAAVLRGVQQEPTQPTETLKEKVMAIPAVLAALLPTLIEQLPKLGKLFGSGSEVSERNLAAATTVMEIVQQATSTPNAQAAVEAITSDPKLREVAAAAIESKWFELTEVGGGIEAARKANNEWAAPDGPRFWFSPAFWVTIVLLPLVYLALVAVLYTDRFSSDIQAMVLGAIFGGLLTGGITAFWFGTSAGSQRKTEIMQR